jgi:ATF/CREB family transcription factor
MNAAARNKNNQFANTSNPQDNSSNNMDSAHDATDAANGLFMLAKGGQTNNQFAVPNQIPVQNVQDQKRNGTDPGESPESHEEGKPATRGGRSKKAATKTESTNNRRKSEASAKGSNKRSKGNSGAAIVDPALEPHDDDDDDDDSEDGEDNDKPAMHPNGKKMTDEEKRRNFLERNR